LIVAVARNGVIGKDGGLPWHVSEDLKHFKKTTHGHAVIMGRKTHDSIGRPLPKRRNIVVTRQTGTLFPGCEAAHSLDEAIALARTTDECPFIIGGASLYEEALPLATELHLTTIDEDVDGDRQLGWCFASSAAKPSRYADAPKSRRVASSTGLRRHLAPRAMRSIDLTGWHSGV
jgi:dihydrofolate reductase